MTWKSGRAISAGSQLQERGCQSHSAPELLGKGGCSSCSDLSAARSTAQSLHEERSQSKGQEGGQEGSASLQMQTQRTAEGKHTALLGFAAPSSQTRSGRHHDRRQHSSRHRHTDPPALRLLPPHPWLWVKTAHLGSLLHPATLLPPGSMPLACGHCSALSVPAPGVSLSGRAEGWGGCAGSPACHRHGRGKAQGGCPGPHTLGGLRVGSDSRRLGGWGGLSLCTDTASRMMLTLLQ